MDGNTTEEKTMAEFEVVLKGLAKVTFSRLLDTSGQTFLTPDGRKLHISDLHEGLCSWRCLLTTC